jgi:hypothetical protein
MVTENNISQIFSKDPAELLDYTFDWSQWLNTGDTILTATCFPSTGIVIEHVTTQATKVIAWVSGGTNGNIEKVTCNITSVQGRTGIRTIGLEIKTK